MATPTTISTLTHLMIESYDERNMRIPSRGFQTMFQRLAPTPRFIPDSESFSYDVIRHGKKISKMLTREQAVRSLGTVQKPNVGMQFQNRSNVFPSIIETASADWNQTLNRVAGEDPYGSLDRFTRLRLLLLDDATEAMKRIAGRIEKMAVESIVDGTVTLDDGVSSQYDFDRSTNNTFAAPLFWTNAAATPLDDLDTLAQNIADNSGEAPDFVVMGRDAFSAFINNTSVKDFADNRRYMYVESGRGLEILAQLPSTVSWMPEAGFKYMAMVTTPDGHNFPVFTYLERYQTDAGTWTDYMEPKTVLMGSSMARLDRVFGPSITIPPSAMEQQEMLSKLGISVPTVTAIPQGQAGVLDPRMFNWDFDIPSGSKTSAYLRAHVAPIYIPTAVDAFGSITATVA